MGYVPLSRSLFASDEEYSSYLVWVISRSWSGRRWLRSRYGTARAVALISRAQPSGGYITHAMLCDERGADV